eukprot:10951181-Ditylum_brightwellii.AAC.2
MSIVKATACYKLTCHLIFGAMSAADVETAVNEVDQVLRFDFKEDNPAKRLAATELIGVLLQRDLQKKPNGFQEVLDHPFF